MSSLNLAFKAGFMAMALVGAATLGGCSFTPALQDESQTNAMSVQFAAPNNPLEQIVYQDLGRRFHLSDNPAAPQISVAVSTFSRDLAQSVTTDPAKDKLLTATGILRITSGGAPVLTTTRQATATYSADTQVLADNSAETAASEQAAHALADTLELTIISALTPTQQPASQ